MNKFLASLALGWLTSLAAQSAEQIERPFTTAYRYNLQGQVTGTISPDPDGSGPLRYLATRTTYERGLVAKVESGELQSWVNDDVAPANWESVSGFTRFVITEYSYDQYGRETAERVKRGDTGETESVIQYNYDSASRVLCKATRMNKDEFATLPGACAQSRQGTHGPDRITRYTYDNLDQVLTEERGVGTSLVQTYVTNVYGGRLLLSQTDANGNKTELRYDSQKRLARRVYPSRTLAGVLNERDYEEYTYEPTGKIKSERKRSGQTITYSYDATNRVRVKDLSDNTHSLDVYFDYYPHGTNRYARFGSSAGPGIRDEVDAFGRLKSRLTNTPQATSSSGPSRIVSYDYDDNGNRISVTHPDGYRFGYAFDGLNRNCGVAESVVPTSCGASHLMVTITYGADGSRKTMARGSTITSYLPDGVGRLRRITQDLPGTTNDLANEFTYSPSNQIRQLTQSNINYAYSGNANRAGDYARNGLNQVTAVAGMPIKHDANGNLTVDPGLSFSMTYDMENRLVGTSGSAAVTSSFKYDPAGRLSRVTVGNSTTEFLYDGSALIAEYVNGAVTRLYVHGDRADEPWVEYVGAALGTAGRRYLLSDHQGSIIGRIDSAGGSLKKLAYDSFGIPLESNEGRFGYTGQLWFRELGLFYYKARVYSPALGRFLQTDPVGYKQGLNLYHYVSNDPLTKIDPTGLGEKEFEQLARSKPQPECTNPEACATLRTMAVVSSIAILAPFLWEAGWWAFLNPAQATSAAVVAGEVAAGVAAGAGPGPGSVLSNTAKAASVLPRLEVSAAKYPDLALNILHAQQAGHPSTLTRGANAAANRAAALDGVPNIRGLSRDEYPFASALQGGSGSWVGHIPLSQQQAQGGLITDFFRRAGVKIGDQYEVVVVP